MKKLRLSYCPTMLPYIEKIKEKNLDIEIVNGQSAAGVLSMLRNNQIDMIMIGRKAYQRELKLDVKEKRLQNGYTLAYSQKSFILEEQLGEVAIKTYISKSIVEKDFAFLKNVEYYDSKEECMEDFLSIPTLVDWNDFEEDYQLLIPMDNNRNKLSSFRAPVIYFNKNVDDSILKSIEDIVNN